MNHHQSIMKILACPVCQGGLAAHNGIQCMGCSKSFPVTKGIPWLFADPEFIQAEWRHRYDFYLAQLNHQIENIKSELNAPQLLETTVGRLRRILQGTVEHRKDIEKLMSEAFAPLHMTADQHAAIKSRLPETQTLMGYYANIHRDWSWGEGENQLSRDMILDTLGDATILGTLAVLGAGACRLAVDLHQARPTGLTIAVDINPLFFMIVDRLLKGRSVRLHEFPVAPKDAQSYVQERKLSWDHKIRDDFHLVLADAMNPPFQPASLDSVLTPWFIDVVHQDTRELLKRINRVLKIDGQWIHFGTLVYFHPNQSSCYSLDELKEMLPEAGFELVDCQQKFIPYLQSPASNQKREENVTCLVARKVREVAIAAPFQVLPPWLENKSLAIPDYPPFRSAAQVNRTLGQILSAVDGQKSIQDLGPVVAGYLGVNAQEAEAILVQLFRHLYEDSLKGSRF